LSLTASEDQDDDEPQAKSYYLREHKPRVNLYEAPPIGEWVPSMLGELVNSSPNEICNTLDLAQN